MPSLSFVNSCISSPPRRVESDYITFPFGLEVGNRRDLFFVYKDLQGVDSTKKNLLKDKPFDKIIDINRLSNNTFYNHVLNAFEIPIDEEIKCFIHKVWRPNFAIYQDTYYFCYDDFPSDNKRKITASSKSYSSFIGKFFKGCSWSVNNYLHSDRDLFSLMGYTTQFGSSSTCTSFQVRSMDYYSNNRGCFSLPLSISYFITNNEDPSDEFFYERGFGDSHSVNSLIYYLKLGNVDLSDGTCCLAQCFGITE